MMIRTTLVGLSIASDVAGVEPLQVNGAPNETEAGLEIQFSYRGSGCLATWPAGLTKAQVTARLKDYMVSADEAAVVESFIGEVY